MNEKEARYLHYLKHRDKYVIGCPWCAKRSGEI